MKDERRTPLDAALTTSADSKVEPSSLIGVFGALFVIDADNDVDASAALCSAEHAATPEQSSYQQPPPAPQYTIEKPIWWMVYVRVHER